MIYTVLYQGVTGIDVEICAGPDWWDALSSGGIAHRDVLAMIPGTHRGTITFDGSQGKVRRPLERRFKNRDRENELHNLRSV